MSSGDGLYCFHWLINSVMLTGIKIPPLIFGTGGGWHKNLRAHVNSFPFPVITTISLPIAMASRRTSKSPPQSLGCKMHRGVPIIGSATISATDMAFFTNIGIGTEQQEDRYRYRYLYSSNNLYINGLCFTLFMWFISASGLLFTLQQALRYEKPYKYTRF